MPLLTKAAGRSMARHTDAQIMALAASSFNGGTAFAGTVDPYGSDWGTAFKTSISNQRVVIGSDGATIYNGTNAASLTDAAILSVVLQLENSDVDTSDLVWVLPPSAKRDILNIDKFTLVNMSGDIGRMKGQFGELYGIPVVITNACPKVVDGASGHDRVGFLLSKEALYMAYQWDVRAQESYLQQYLGTLYTMDNLYGLAVARDYAGIAIAIPNQ